jgi:hypothetical protein
VVFSNVAQTLVTRVGVRRVLTSGLLLAAAALAILARLPVHGSYVRDVLPAFLLGGVGLAFSFVPVTIAGLTGVGGSDAGVASGLINTSRQIGGAVGLAAASTIATTSTDHYLRSHAGRIASDSGALTHGFQSALYVLTALAIVGAAIAAILVRPEPRRELEHLHDEPVTPLQEAA